MNEQEQTTNQLEQQVFETKTLEQPTQETQQVNQTEPQPTQQEIKEYLTNKVIEEKEPSKKGNTKRTKRGQGAFVTLKLTTETGNQFHQYKKLLGNNNNSQTIQHLIKHAPETKAKQAHDQTLKQELQQ